MRINAPNAMPIKPTPPSPIPNQKARDGPDPDPLAFHFSGVGVMGSPGKSGVTEEELSNMRCVGLSGGGIGTVLPSPA